MYIPLNGIGKITYVSVLRVLLICKSLNFTAVFTEKKLNFSGSACNFLYEKVNFNLIYQLILPFIAFEEHY